MMEDTPARYAVLSLLGAALTAVSCVGSAPPESAEAPDRGDLEVRVTADTLWTRKVAGPFDDRTYLEISIPVATTNRTATPMEIPLCRGLGLMASMYRLEEGEWRRVYARPCPLWEFRTLDPGEEHRFHLDITGAVEHDFAADSLDGRFRIVLDMTEIGGESVRGMGRSEGEAWRMQEFGSNTFVIRDHLLR
jgi:hypothetical protein